MRSKKAVQRTGKAHWEEGTNPWRSWKVAWSGGNMSSNRAGVSRNENCQWRLRWNWNEGRGGIGMWKREDGEVKDEVPKFDACWDSTKNGSSQVGGPLFYHSRCPTQTHYSPPHLHPFLSS